MVKQTLSFSGFVLTAVFFLNGCEEPPQAFVAPSRPVKTIIVGGGGSVDSRMFPAVVDAIQKADISFRVKGKVQKILVKEGDHVEKDQLLAELDPTDFKITLSDRQASYDTAKANNERAKKLVGKGVISRVDHDKLRAQYFTAQSGRDQAQQDLLYTKLKANFSGHIAARYVENFEEVLSSQKIFALEDVSSLKLKIDVPENLMIAVDKNRSEKNRGLYAQFDNIKGQKFPLEFSETTTKADPYTKTFKVTLVLNEPKDYNILPGMTATVIAELFPTESAAASSIAIPVSAVIAGTEKQATVWVIDENSMTANSKNITPGLMVGSLMHVKGLNPGERIVVAGASFLREGMKVTLLETGEQAE